MFAREESIHIEAPPQAIYDYVSDIGRHPEWAAQKLVMRELGDGRYESLMTMFPMKARAVIHIEAAERPSRFVYVADDDVSGPHRWHFDINPEGSGSRVSFGFERIHEAFLIKVLQPVLLFPLIGHPGLIRGLSKIKRYLEGTATQVSAASTAS